MRKKTFNPKISKKDASPQPNQTNKANGEDQEIPLIDENPIRSDKLGFKNTPRFYRKFPNISEAKKYEVRDKTFKAVKEGSFDGSYVASAYKQVSLFTSPQSQNTFKGTQVLGRFDVLAAPIKMDYNYEWKAVEGNKEFLYTMLQRSMWVKNGC
ncbi:MAG: hypothetical protein HWD61_15130 [Parachlamydiaceae bacterium]|nr:MAG: hypothetical protein HWD61_15130 [Parachlamydiaceae bacterium]